MSNMFLVEMDTALRLRKWHDEAIRFDSTTVTFDSTTVTFDGKHGVFSRALDEVSVVNEVDQDGTALASVASEPLVETTTGSWYYDAAANRVWIHTAGNVDSVSGKEILVILVELLAKERTVVKDRSGVPVVWEGRVVSIPSVSQVALTEELSAAGSAVSFGELVLANGDQRYTKMLGLRLVQGREVRVWYGDSDAAFTAFTLWAKATMEAPVVDESQVHVVLGSIARRLDSAIGTVSFTLAAYPGMDAAIDGMNIPKCWGPVFGAEAFRIASGRWKVSSLAMTSIDAAKKSDGTAAAITGTDLPNGEFTVNASFDTESKLYVDGVGVNVSRPGAVMKSILQDAGIPLASIDAAGLDALDTNRPVDLGLQARTGSVRTALDLVAQSAFAEWAVNRSNVFTARIRRRDEGNFVVNAGFEVDASGWTADNGGAVARTTALAFRGSASLQVTKPAAQPLARAIASGLALATGTVYVVTCLAALVSGATSKFRLGLAMPDGREYLSDPVSLSATKWTRVKVSLAAAALGAVITWDDASRTFDLDNVFFASGGSTGALVVYPQYGGADDVVVAVDEVELVKAVVVDDSVGHLLTWNMAEVVLWEVLAGWNYDGRLAARRFSSKSDSGIQSVYATSESRSIQGVLKTAADAATVAQAALTYFSSGRLRIQIDVLGLEASVNVGDVFTLDPPTSAVTDDRRPVLPDGQTLYRVVGFQEERPADSPGRTRVVAETIYDPVTDQMTIAAA